MRTATKMLMCLAAVLVLTATTVRADDPAEIADLQSRIATLEAKMMAPAGGGDAETLTSMYKKGVVKIGGEFKVNVEHRHTENADDSNDEVDQTIWSEEIDLFMRVDAGADSYAHFKFEMDKGAPDLVDEAYYMWKNVRGSGWSILFGLGDVPFGQYEGNAYMDPCSDGGMLLKDAPGGDDNVAAKWYGPNGERDIPPPVVDDLMPTAANPNPMTDAMYKGQHYERSVITGEVWQTCPDEMLTLGAAYTFREMVTLEASLFQDDSNVYEDRSHDTGFFESYALRLSGSPMEGLDLSVSFINTHDNMFDEDGEDDNHADNGRAIGAVGQRAQYNMYRIMAERWAAGTMSATQYERMTGRADYDADGVTAAQYTSEMNPNIRALSLAGNYETPNGKWNVYAEYIHTWNANHYEEVDTDTVTAGMVYALTEKVDLIGEFGWVGIDNEAWDAHNSGLDFEEDVYTMELAASYTLDNGISFLLGYRHEWYDTDLGGWADTDADLIGFETAWKF